MSKKGSRDNLGNFVLFLGMSFLLQLIDLSSFILANLLFAHHWFKLFPHDVFLKHISHKMCNKCQTRAVQMMLIFLSIYFFQKYIFFEITKTKIYFWVTLIEPFLSYPNRIFLFVNIFYFSVNKLPILFFTNVHTNSQLESMHLKANKMTISFVII